MGNTNDKPSLPWGPAVNSTTALREPDAWFIALLWHSRLHGYVTVTTQWPQLFETEAITFLHRTSTDYTLVERLEWIEFDFQRAHARDWKDLMRIARAATIAWFALSCCPGYGADENPVFWKRVLSVYMQPESMGTSINKVDLATRTWFFDHPDRPFPRIRFHGFNHSLPLEYWWDEPTKQSDARMLHDVVKRLETIMLRSRWNRTIPVSIRVSIKDINPVKLAQRFLKHSKVKNHEIPRFQLAHVIYQRYNDKYDLASNAQIRLWASMNLSTQESNRIHLAMESLLAQEQGKPEPTQLVAIHVLDLWCAATSVVAEIDCVRKMIAAWCSVLPHTKTIANIRAVSITQWRNYDAAKGAWLGYGIFHPDTARNNSSIEGLTLEVRKQHSSTIHSLRSMMSSNSLLVGLGISAVSAPYTKARVRSGSIVYAGIQGSKLYTFPSACWVTLCKMTPSQPYLNEWACIVLPGHGIGWVHAENILEIQELAPTPSCVRRLRLILGDFEHSQKTIALLLDVISALGEQLTYLHVESYVPLETETVQSVLRLCPNITSLRIRHDGSSWTQPYVAIAPEYPRLQELELTISNTLASLEGPQLADLKAFRVVCSNTRRFDANRAIVQAVLLRYPRIQYLNWHERIIPASNEPTVDRCVKRSRQLLDPLTTNAYDTIVVKFRLDARLAFLSVIRHLRLIRLPCDIIQLIFDLSSNRVPRLLYICTLHEDVDGMSI